MCAICEESVDVLDLCPMCELQTGTTGRAVISPRPCNVNRLPRLCIRRHEMTYIVEKSRWRCRQCTRQLRQALRDKKKEERAA